MLRPWLRLTKEHATRLCCLDIEYNRFNGGRCLFRRCVAAADVATRLERKNLDENIQAFGKRRRFGIDILCRYLGRYARTKRWPRDPRQISGWHTGDHALRG